jgi:hypothetical protein
VATGVGISDALGPVVGVACRHSVSVKRESSQVSGDTMVAA